MMDSNKPTNKEVVDGFHKKLQELFVEHRGREPNIKEDIDLRQAAFEAVKDGYRIKPEPKPTGRNHEQ